MHQNSKRFNLKMIKGIKHNDFADSLFSKNTKNAKIVAKFLPLELLRKMFICRNTCLPTKDFESYQRYCYVL